MTPFFAVHIPDACLTAPWLIAGFTVAGLLALIGSIRVRDEEIPRIALMAAAFFVASSLHAKIGGSSVHLLFNGLAGVILGRRAALAILVGLFLQAALMGHGGMSTIGVNACVMTIPALIAGGLFRLAWPAVCRSKAAWLEYGLGFLLGAGSVALTVVLAASVLIWGAAQDWTTTVYAVVLLHIPVAAVEGLICGFTLGYLARVKPELLGEVFKPIPAQRSEARPLVEVSIFLMAATILLGGAAPAHAHPIHFDHKVICREHKVIVEAWFSSDEPPRNSYLRVIRPDGSLLAEMPLDERGLGVFTYREPEDLRVELRIPGHPTSFTIARAELADTPPVTPTSDDLKEKSTTHADLKEASAIHEVQPFADKVKTDEKLRDVLAGVGFVLGLGAFVMSVRNAQRLKRLETVSSPVSAPPATSPTEAIRR